MADKIACPNCENGYVNRGGSLCPRRCEACNGTGNRNLHADIKRLEVAMDQLQTKINDMTQAMSETAKGQTMNETELSIIGEMQCPGCTCGCAPAAECESFKPSNEYGFCCEGHSSGTMMSGVGWIYLGLPKGFNRVGAYRAKGDSERRNNIRLWIAPDIPGWDFLNVPIWAMEEDGFLYVRTYCPRINTNFVDIVKGGTMEFIPSDCHVLDVADFPDEID